MVSGGVIVWNVHSEDTVTIVGNEIVQNISLCIEANCSLVVVKVCA